VTLNCDATGTPKPTITWRREDGEKLRLCPKENMRSVVEEQGGGEKLEDNCQEVDQYVGDSLTLRNINRFQSGIYLCIGKNNVPPSVSKRVRLYVDFPPTLWITHQLVGVEIGGNALIECLTAAHPKSLNFWHDKNDLFIRSDQRNEKYISTVEEGTPSYYNALMRLQILNVSYDDLGKYSCKAKNSLGSTDGEITLYEIVTSTSSTELGVWEFWESTAQTLITDVEEEISDAERARRRDRRRKMREQKQRDRERRRKEERMFQQSIQQDALSASAQIVASLLLCSSLVFGNLL